MMLAGPASERERCAAVFAAMAGRVFTISDRVGDAAATKIVNNLLAGVNLAAGAEALALADALDCDFAPRAAARILAKDVGIACEVVAHACGSDLRAGGARRVRRCGGRQLRRGRRRGAGEARGRAAEQGRRRSARLMRGQSAPAYFPGTGPLTS